MTKSAAKQSGLPVVHERAAGIDIGSRFHVVAVTPDCSDEPVQTFQAFTGDLQRMVDWLVSVGVKTVAMESTGVYWVPVFEILEERGIEVILANAREARAVPGQKVMSMTPNGYNACTPVDCCVPVSARPEISPHCGFI